MVSGQARGGDALRGGAGDVACGVDRGDAERVARFARKAGVAVAGRGGGSDLGAVTEQPVAGDPTLSVEAVHERVAEVAATALVASPVGVDGGVASVQAAAVDIRRGDAGDVAGGIDCGDAERVGRAARQSGEAEGRCSGCPDLRAVTEHAVAGDADVVGRGVHESATDVWPTELGTSPVGVEGGVVSGQAAVVTFVVAVPETFPAASTAATPRV